MACRFIPGGGVICGPRSRQKRCARPGCDKPADKLCDFKLRGAATGKTCSMPICSGCAHVVDKDTDYCHVHAKEDRRLVP